MAASCTHDQPHSAALLLTCIRPHRMAAQPQAPVERRRHDPTLQERYRAGHPRPLAQGKFRSLGLGLITGASDDDPAAIGTYAAAAPRSALRSCGSLPSRCP